VEEGEKLMSSVDDRIVNMQFNNKQFESGVSQSQRSLAGLEQSIGKTAKSKGLTGLAASVDGVKNRFGAMQVAGVAAVATIASKATAMGLNMIKSLTLKPIMDGFNEYQTNLNSIQTIVANTGKSVPRVNAALAQLNHYADQTIYNFSEMAHNIGTFTAAGVDLKTSVASIKGIANLAALSGSSSQQASMAMYQLSQAIAAGQVHLQDWNSVVNAGMGGKVFQTALARTGANMGTLSKNAVQMVGPMKKLQIQGQSFRESISAKPGQKAWLSSDVLTETLKQISGAYSVAQLKAKGYSKEQIKNIESLANRSFNAATQIKTLPQLFGVVQESIGSMWGQTFQAILGDFNQSKDLWGRVGAKLVGPFGIITQMSNNFTGMMQNWADQGGRNAVINGFKMMFGSLGQVLTQLKSAFKEIFPPDTTNNLLALSQGFYKLTTYLNPSSKALENLKLIFGGVFAVFHIGITIVKALAVGFGAFFGQVFQGSGKARGGILDFMGHIGKMLINVDKFLTSGGKMVDLFRNIGNAAGLIAGRGLSIASGIILGIISGISGSMGQIQNTVITVATNIVNWFKSALGIHSPAAELVPVGTQIVAGIGQGILAAVKGIGAVIGKVVHSILGIFGNVLSNSDPFQWAGIMNTLFTGTLLISVWRFFHAFSGIGNAIKQTFGQLTNTLQAMQSQIKANAIKQIAIAVGILALSIIALSMVKPAKIGVAIGAIAALMGVMVASMKALGSIGKITDENGQSVQKGAGQLLALSAAMIGMATAVAILSAAVVLLGHQKPEVLAKGIGAVAVMMAIMVAAVQQVAKLGDEAKTAGGAMVLMATAMDVLTIAVFALGSMNITTLAKGIGSLALMMGIMVGALLVLSKAGKGALQAAGAILVVSAAMTALAAVVFAFGQMDITTLAKGFGAMGIALGLVVGSLLILSAEAPAVIIVAQAMALMSAAMVGLAIAVGMFGSMDTGTLAKGFIAVAVGLGLLLLAAAAAIPLAPGLAILSETFMALGGALALAGLGMLAFGTGFALMAVVGSAGVAVLVLAFQSFMALLPALGVQFAAAFVTFVQTIAAASDRLRPAFDKIFKNMIGVIQDNIPVMGHLIQTLITTAINIIKRSVPQWVEAGFTIIDKFIKSAAKHVPAMVDNALKLITGFMNAISRNLGPLADSAAKMIISFINAVSAAIDNNSEAMGKAGGKLGISLVKGMMSGMKGMVSSVIGAAEDLAKSCPRGYPQDLPEPADSFARGYEAGFVSCPRCCSRY
jgi:tape measure domain-containing protein